MRLLCLSAAILWALLAPPAVAQQSSPQQVPATNQQSPTNQPGATIPPVQSVEVGKSDIQASPKTLYPEWLSGLIKDGDTLIRTLAVIVAAGWAYFRFVKGRVFRSRLEPNVIGVAVVRNAFTYLHVTVMIKNVGLSKVEIKQDGTSLRIFSAVNDRSAIATSANWDHDGTFSVFSDHSWIEPGETIEDQKLISTPGEDTIAFQAQLRVTDHRTVWYATGVVMPEKNDNPEAEVTG